MKQRSTLGSRCLHVRSPDAGSSAFSAAQESIALRTGSRTRDPASRPPTTVTKAEPIPTPGRTRGGRPLRSRQNKSLFSRSLGLPGVRRGFPQASRAVSVPFQRNLYLAPELVSSQVLWGRRGLAASSEPVLRVAAVGKLGRARATQTLGARPEICCNEVEKLDASSVWTARVPAMRPVSGDGLTTP